MNNRISLRSMETQVDKYISNNTLSELIEDNNKAFVFIVSSYNNKEWYKWNLDSIFKTKIWVL